MSAFFESSPIRFSISAIGMWMAPGIVPLSLISDASQTSTTIGFLVLSSFFFSSRMEMRSATIQTDDTLAREMKQIDVINPATEEIVDAVPRRTVKDVDRAVHTAQAA